MILFIIGRILLSFPILGNGQSEQTFAARLLESCLTFALVGLHTEATIGAQTRKIVVTYSCMEKQKTGAVNGEEMVMFCRC